MRTANTPNPVVITESPNYRSVVSPVQATVMVTSTVVEWPVLSVVVGVTVSVPAESYRWAFH